MSWYALFRVPNPLPRSDVRSAQQQRAEILYSGLSGEEILQQWLTNHPGVVERYEEEEGRKKRKRREEVEVADTNQTPQSLDNGPSLSQPGSKYLLPPYLEPYRGVLPPSLVPPSARANFFLHTLLPADVSGWG